ncbi:GNAT family N-acetyltransferase [Bacillus spongiae]|uniref:GNAT family N-acetyltransferase n=1 Tax=Bacillus spongiae TaxID=2683610 RepID=A0ABU8HH67_9BACI
MKIKQFEDPKTFKDEVYDYLLKNEAKNNLPIGIINQMLEYDRYPDAFLAAVYEEELIGVYVMTPPHALILTCTKGREIDVHQKMIHYLLEKKISIPGVVAEKNCAIHFAGQWEQITGKPFQTKMQQRIYDLHQVTDIPLSEGEFILANRKDIDLVANWIIGFVEDTGEGEITPEDAQKRAVEMIEKEESVYLWKVGGVPVSMARRARHTEKGCSVNFVYTPDAYRKKGYGSSVVKSLSLKLLEKYDFCTLYTDLNYPTSNKIYMEIGYQPVCDSVHIEFA